MNDEIEIDPEILESLEIVDDEDDSSSTATYSINSYGADYTVDSLVKRMNKKSFIIPEFQRGFIWTKTQASRFIESLLMGLPVPGIFLYKRPEDGKHLVIDGQQRLKTVQAFCNGMLRDRTFKLSGVRAPWEGKSYEELTAEDQLRIDDSVIHAIIFSQEKPEETIDSIHFVFERINSGGVRLSPQEIRNCIAEGPFINLTSELNEHPDWRKIYGAKSPRAKDQELIIRVLAFLELEKPENYQRPMSAFLSKFSKRMNSSSEAELNSMKACFEKTARVCWEALNGDAFRPVRSLNAAVLEAVMSTIAKIIRDTQKTPDPLWIKHRYDQLLASERFKEGWERATAGEEAVKVRTEEAKKAFSLD